MYPALLLMLVLVAFTAVVHQYAPPTRKCFSHWLCLASVAAAVLLIDYFVQLTVMQPSIEQRQLAGWRCGPGATRAVSSSLSRSSETC